MRARRLGPAVVGVLCLVVSVLVFGSASALASVKHPFYRSFGSFAGVQSIAVDQVSGDVLVYDTGASRVYKFDAEGNPVSFSSTGTNAIVGVPGAQSEAQIAVDSSNGPGKGDIYVATGESNGFTVSIYGPDGSLLGTLSEQAPHPWGEPCGVAVDPSGNVYVGLFSGFANKYEPKGSGPVTNADYVSSLEGLGGPCNIAVDSVGNVFAANWPAGPVGRFPGGSIVDLAGSSLAVDPAGDEVYVDEGGQVSQYGPHGEPFEAPLTTFASSGSGAISGSFGIAVNGTSGTVYVSNGRGAVNIYKPSPPVVTRQWSSAIKISTATINATLRSTGEPTTYHFEYGTTTSYGASVPVPDGSIGTGEEITVTESLSGLREGTTYHYRVAATSANGTTYGEDRIFTTGAPSTAAPVDTCPNASLRIAGSSAGLPDCRAYEMVSPLDKNGADIGGNGSFTVRAATDGERAEFMADAGFADTAGSGNVGATNYVASRSVDGWSTHSVTPPSAPTAHQIIAGGVLIEGYADDLQHLLWYGVQVPNADPGTGGANFYRQDAQTGRMETITVPSGSETLPFFGMYSQATITGYSSDVGVVAFASRLNLLPQTIGTGTKIYEWRDGQLGLADILPDGSILTGDSGGGAVSSDGSRVLFSSPPNGSSSPQLYIRKNGASTVWVSRSEASNPNPEPQEVQLDAESRDGRKVVFTTSTQLLDTDPGGGGLAIYEYTDGPSPETEPNLTFITRVPNLGNGNAFVGMSDDGTHIYFYNEPEEAGAPYGMYLWDNGTVHFIAKTNEPVSGDNRVNAEVRISSDGRRMAFLRTPGLASEPELAKPAANQDVGTIPNTGEGWAALYLYDEGTEKVTCVSCPPNGAAMTADVALSAGVGYGTSGGLAVFHQRYMSNDGRFVFFTSRDALVPQDTNGLDDAYEYNVETHEVKLLSSGTGDQASSFMDASANGSDVFLLSAQKLTGWDTDTLTDVYDVRIDGGFPEPAAAPVACEGDACHGVPSAIPSFNTASGFSGLGNQSAARSATAKGKKVKSRKHVRKKHKRRRGKRARRSSEHAFGRRGR